MIIHVRCVESFAGDAFGHGNHERFEEGRVYALPSFYVQGNTGKFVPIHQKETKPMRQALEIKGNNSSGNRTHQPRRVKAKS